MRSAQTILAIEWMTINKVYTGQTSIGEHIKRLDKLYVFNSSIEQHGEPRPDDKLEANKPEPRKQSIEIQRLKREAGLT